MVELLGKLGLSERIWKNSGCNWKGNINYDDAGEKRRILKEEAFAYLKENLG